MARPEDLAGAAKRLQDPIGIDYDVTRLPDLTRPLAIPEFISAPSPVVTSIEANYASEFHKRLVAWINDFDASLDNQHEVGVRLVSFGQTVVFHLEDLGFWNPSLLSFSGHTDSGDPVELIQHVSQISILLMKLPRKDPTKPKRPIGFHVTEQECEDGEHGAGDKEQ